MNEVQEHLDSLAVYGSEAGDAACPACGHPRAIHGVYGCHEGDAVVFTEEIVALRAKAALFDVLAARIAAGAWVICDTVGGVKILLEHTGERVFDVTLAGVVEKAMRAEGGAR